MFMWPMLVFGYENFMMMCLEPEFERIMDEFAEINRRVFRAFARLPVNFAVCHDDIVLSNGPVCSPKWMHKFIFPRYEEYWAILKKAGKEVIFMADGCVDAFVDDVMACGARGIISEPFTNYKAIARRYENCFIAGEGDNRILSRNNPSEIRKMVESMAETGRMSGGYMMCIGNHIPFNTPPEAIKRYFDLSAELAHRK
jgi:uroporphyrinogen-III decarboxylase